MQSTSQSSGWMKSPPPTRPHSATYGCRSHWNLKGFDRCGQGPGRTNSWSWLLQCIWHDQNGVLVGWHSLASWARRWHHRTLLDNFLADVPLPRNRSRCESQTLVNADIIDRAAKAHDESGAVEEVYGAQFTRRMFLDSFRKVREFCQMHMSDKNLYIKVCRKLWPRAFAKASECLVLKSI